MRPIHPFHIWPGRGVRLHSLLGPGLTFSGDQDGRSCMIRNVWTMRWNWAGYSMLGRWAASGIINL